MSEEIKPCPFCGQPGELISTRHDMNYVCCSNKERRHIVEMGPYRWASSAIKVWNARREPQIASVEE